MGKIWTAVATRIARAIFPQPEIVFEEPIDKEEPVVFLANHSGAEGPAYAYLYIDEPKKIWLINYVVDKKKAPDFIFHDFMCGEGKKHKWFWRLLSRLTAFLLVPLCKDVPHVPVYHDARMLDTFRDSVDALVEGKRLVVFPECPRRYSEYLNDIYEGFAEIGKLYYEASGKSLKFLPTYICKDLRKILVGKPISFEPSIPARKQRKVIHDGIRDGIVRLAESLPEHKIRPFLTEEWYACYGQFADNPLEYWRMFE